MSGPLFEKIFGSELLFFGVGDGRVFFVLFCLCFCSIIWFFASENVSKSGKVWDRKRRGVFLRGSFLLGFGVFFALLSLPLLLLLLLSGGRLGFPFSSFVASALQDAGLPLPGQAGAAHMFFMSCLVFSLSPGRSPPPLFLLLLSFLSLFLSLSLFEHA